MAKRPSQFGDDDGTHWQARKQKIVESRDEGEESDMGMDVGPIQDHPHTEVQLGASSPDPSTSWMESHDESAAHASEMAVDRWTTAEHLAFDQKVNEVFSFLSSNRYSDEVLPNIIRRIAEQNDKKMSLGDADILFERNKWLRDPLIACREKGSFRDIRRLSECLLYTFPINKFS